MKPVVALLRQRGIRLIVYLDDILIMAESQNMVLHQAASTLNLLESLGFIVNYKNYQLAPTLHLPGETMSKIRKRCKAVLDLPEFSILELSKFLGLLTSSIQAVFLAPLHFRNLRG